MKLTDSENHARELNKFVTNFKGYWSLRIETGNARIWFLDMGSVDYPKEIGWYASRRTYEGREILSGAFRTLEEAMLWVNKEGYKR